ncbi:MAG: hypothetical protein EAZ08_13235 [Cytophagales bacterium]|nr:MAG: hypothetical protein EAZ08_13235 [Cytophagales bacterium]
MVEAFCACSSSELPSSSTIGFEKPLSVLETDSTENFFHCFFKFKKFLPTLYLAFRQPPFPKTLSVVADPTMELLQVVFSD